MDLSIETLRSHVSVCALLFPSGTTCETTCTAQRHHARYRSPQPYPRCPSPINQFSSHSPLQVADGCVRNPSATRAVICAGPAVTQYQSTFRHSMTAHMASCLIRLQPCDVTAHSSMRARMYYSHEIQNRLQERISSGVPSNCSSN